MPKSLKENYRVVAKNFSLFRGGKSLIEQANFAIFPGRKVGLIGRNGRGKTTLLETIWAVAEGRDLPEGVEIEGRLSIFPGTRIGYFPQEIKIEFPGTVEAYLDFCASNVAGTYRRWEEIQRRMAGDTSHSVLDEYGEILEEMTVLDAWDYPRKKEEILLGLGLDRDYLKRDIQSLSGGEAARVALAGVLISFPNLLLLDEPTNNLDFRALRFLKEWIRKGSFSAIIVSHDRGFLDETIGEILEIDEETHQVSLFGGNYSFYAQVKKEMFEAQQRAYEEQRRKREQLKKSAKALETKAREFEDTSRNAFYRAKGAGLARRSRVQLERIQRELSQIPEPKPPKRPTFPVLEIKPYRGNLITLSNVTFGYPGIPILEGFSFSMKGRERVAIIGPNGAGKTTFLRLVMGSLLPLDGRITACQDIAYLPQDPLIGDLSLNTIDYFRQLAKKGITEEEAKEILGKVLLRDPGQRLGDLSIGQIRRIQIASLFVQNPSLLILDEPTNHLDIFTIEMLEDALRRFPGGLLVVSHDTIFLRNIQPERILLFSGRGRIQEEREPLNLEEIFRKLAS